MILNLKDGTGLTVDIPDDFDELALRYGLPLLRSVGVAGVRANLTRIANKSIVAAGVAADDDERRRAVARFLGAWRPRPSAGGRANRLLASVAMRRLADAGPEQRVDAVLRIAERLGVTVRVMGVVGEKGEKEGAP